MPDVAAIHGAPTSVGKALSLLSAFRPFDGGATLTELAAEARVSKSTAHRLLGILQETGFIRRHGTTYFLSFSMFELGSRALQGEARRLKEIALAPMMDLHDSCAENVHLATLVGRNVVYVETIFGSGSIPSPARVGDRFPAHATALGKSLLAYSDAETFRAVVDPGMARLTPRTTVTPGALLQQIRHVRAEGFAVDLEEARIGMVCVAAPIRCQSGRAVAAVSVCGAADRLKIDRISERVRLAAQHIGRRLGTDAELLANDPAVLATG